MQSLVELARQTRGGVFQLVCLDPTTMKPKGSGTGFWCGGFLVTNQHVMCIPFGTSMWIRREGDQDPKKDGLLLSQKDWFDRIVTTSAEQSYDYAVMDCPELRGFENLHEFEFELPPTDGIGSPIAFMGYPLQHENLTLHGGIISSFYKKKSAHIIQIDASVNGGNSGGPLINIETAGVIGWVSRKATGLSETFEKLRQVIGNTIRSLEAKGPGTVSISSIDYVGNIIEGQKQLISLTDEIERQANVGIGYAISAKHLLDEDWFQRG